MRLAISSLLLATGVATAALAQDAVQPAPAPAAPAAEATPAAPAAPAETAAPAPAPAAEPAPPPPTLPTTGEAAAVISLLDRVCVPVVRGQELDTVAKSIGMKQNKRERTWAMPLGGHRNYQVIVFPVGSNPGVCNAELRYTPGQDEQIASALNIWSFLQRPQLNPAANYTQPQDPDGLKRVRRSWEAVTSNQSIGVNFSTVTKPDGSPLNRNYATATLQYQERKF